MLDLPQDTFDMMLPYLGLSEDETIQTLKSHVQPGHEPAHARGYDDTGFPLSTKREHVRIHRLSTLPGYGALQDAFHLLLKLFDSYVEKHEGNNLDDPDEEEQSIIDVYDEPLRDMIVYHLRVTSVKHDDRWKIHEYVDELVKASFLLTSLSWAGPYEDLKYHYPYIKVFERTMVLLRELHSRETGEMLAGKVAGDVLPPELVEMIGDCFYDKGLLASLGV